MEGDAHRQARVEREATVGKRRLEAQLAMESPTHRVKRELKERIAREVSATATRETELEQAQRATVTKQMADTEVAAKAKTAAAEAAFAARITAARQAATETKNLQGRPVHINTIRTLKTDLAEAASHGGSIAGAIIREGELGKSGPTNAPRQSHTLIIIVFTLFILGLIAGGGTLAYRKWLANSTSSIINSATSTGAAINSNTLSIIPSDRRADFEVTDQNLPTLLTKVHTEKSQGGTTGTITELVFLKNNTRLTLSAWKTLFNLPFPDNLTRGLDPTFMFGFYHDSVGSTPVIILKTKSASQSFADFLAWENNLPFVWDALIGKPPIEAQNIATTTPIFRDQVLQNLDLRLLEGVDVPQSALYGFLDPNTIILTQTRTAFLEILNRFRPGRVFSHPRMILK